MEVWKEVRCGMDFVMKSVTRLSTQLVNTIGMPPIRRQFHPRNIPCSNGCGKFFLSTSGMKCHLNTCKQIARAIQLHPPATIPSPIHSPSPPQLQPNDDEDDYFGGADDFRGHDNFEPDSERENDIEESAPNLRRVSSNRDATNESRGNVEFHSKINGELLTSITNEIRVC